MEKGLKSKSVKVATTNDLKKAESGVPKRDKSLRVD